MDDQAKIAKAQVDKLIDLASQPPKGTGVKNIREVGPKDYNITFKQYMDEHAELRDMIAEGRSKLEWERKIPDEKLMDLKSMLDSPDFKTNLPKVIKRIYELAWEQFSDLPRGEQKNRSMHKL